MEIRFEASGPQGERDLQSLYRWLSGDRSLRGHVQVERVADGAVGRMGPGLEAVLAMVSTATAVAQLPFAYLAWRQGRRPQASLTLRITGGDPEEVRAMLEQLGETASGPDAAPRRQNTQDASTADGDAR